MFEYRRFLLFGFFLSVVVSQCSDKCDVCSTQIQGCIACLPGFTRNFINQCHEEKQPFCQLLDLAGDCFLCRQLFNKIDNKCVKDYSGCSIYETPNDCGQCIYGTRLIDRRCQGTLNCAIYSGENVCAECYKGYRLQNNICFDSSPGCQEVNPDHGACLKCRQGYTMSAYNCLKNQDLIPHCEFYDPTTLDINCFRCLTGFDYDRDKKKCNLIRLSPPPKKKTESQTNINGDDLQFGGTGGPQTIEFCVVRDGDLCIECEKGRQFIGGKCQRILPGCQLMAAKLTCSQCDSYFVLSQGKCIDLKCQNYNAETGQCLKCTGSLIVNPSTFACDDLGCQRYEKGKCVKCRSNFYLPQSQQVCKPFLQGCQKMSPTGQCTQCSQEYYQIEGICRKDQKIPGCVSQENGTCLTCEVGRLQANGVCINIFCAVANQQPCLACVNGYTLNEGYVCVDSFCDVYDQHICINCVDGYGLDPTGRCRPLPPFCFDIGLSGQCITCLNGYSLQNGVCVALVSIPNCIKTDLEDISQCIICKERYYPTQDRKTCLEVSKLCNDYNPQTGFCFTCRYGLIPSNGACTDSNCLESANDQCFRCKDLYQVDQDTGVCHNRDPFCSELFNQQCQGCVEGYYLDANDYCARLPFGCKIANFQTGQCLECNDGFSINSGACSQVKVIPNCLQADPSNSSKCLFCDTGYYTLSGGCSMVSPLCSNAYNPTNGFCLSCIEGYNLQQQTGKCIDPNCEAYNGDTCTKCNRFYTYNQNEGLCLYSDVNCANVQDNRCFGCVTNYYIRIEGYCERKPNFCENVTVQGVCTSCIPNYRVRNGLCEVIPALPPTPAISNCEVEQFSSCVQCRARFYLEQGRCNPIGMGCDSYNGFTGECFTCFTGYKLELGKCLVQIIETQTNNDPNCLVFNDDRCDQCSQRYYYNGEKCVPVNPLCREYNSTGACTSCYPSYRVQGTKCIIAPTQDPNCKSSSLDGVCFECYYSYFSRNGKCQRVNPLCKSSDPTNGNCMSCYKGYKLRDGNCAIFFQDRNCKTFDNDGECMECVSKHYLSKSNNRCMPANPNCKDYDRDTGACTQCYVGYAIQGRNCVIKIVGIDDQPNCKIRQDDICLECYLRYYILNGKCQQVNPSCRDFNPSNGACTSCYPGYVLEQDLCSLPSPQEIDEYCKTVSQIDSKICQECYKGYIPVDGRCTVRDDNCANYDPETYVCLGCYSGYALTNAGCIVQTEITGDPNCIEVENGLCKTCADGFFKNRQGMCELADPQCKNYGDLGLCLLCYDGYVLSGDGKCYNPLAGAGTFIANCRLYDQQGMCNECQDRYFLRGNVCNFVSILCGAFNRTTGKCLSCSSESYNLQDGQCIQLISIVEGCSRYSGPYCAECEVGYYFNVYTCIRVDENCVEFDYTTNTCRTCVSPYSAQGSICI